MTPILLLLVGACAPGQEGDFPPDWYDPGVDYDVMEPVEFTDVNYAFPANDADGIGALYTTVFPVPTGSPGADNYAFGPDDQFPSAGGCSSFVDNDLPAVIEGVVTAHPRFYFKTSGCSWDSDEKYYGSYFIQDRTGGLFVLGDTKVAHFDMGDHIRILLRGAKTSFELDMGYTYDFIEYVGDRQPIYYEVATEPFADMATSPIARVWQVTGTVTTDKDTFGEFKVETDDGVQYSIALDVELNRRGVGFPIGTRITATGPVLFSYDIYSIVIMRIGQVTVQDDQ